MNTKIIIIFLVGIFLVTGSSLFFIIEYFTTDEAEPVIVRYPKGEPMNNSLLVGKMAQKVCSYLEMECPDEPQFKANYHEETQSGGFGYIHNGNSYSFRIQDNQLLVRDLETREWEIILKLPPNDPIFDANRNGLSHVLDYCNNTSEFKNFILYFYSNDTHNIDNNTCEWKEHVTFPNTDNLCVPYIDKWVSGEEIRNQTHIFDTDSCTWKIDQNYDTVNSKGCPLFCPKDDKTILDKFEDMPEVVAFYAKYDDAQASVRENHISYFAGSDNDALMRMNIFFDENQTITEIDTHCYFQKVHQYEISQEDIVNIFEKYDCKK